MRLSAIATLFFALLAIAAPLDESMGSDASPNIQDGEARCRQRELNECLEVRITYLSSWQLGTLNLTFP